MSVGIEYLVVIPPLMMSRSHTNLAAFADALELIHVPFCVMLVSSRRKQVAHGKRNYAETLPGFG